MVNLVYITQYKVFIADSEMKITLFVVSLEVVESLRFLTLFPWGIFTRISLNKINKFPLNITISNCAQKCPNLLKINHLTVLFLDNFGYIYL